MKGFLGTLVVLFVMLVLVGPAAAETVAGEAGIVNLVDGRVCRQPLRDGLGVVAVALHA